MSWGDLIMTQLLLHNYDYNHIGRVKHSHPKLSK